MSAREQIADRLWWSVPSSDDADAKAKASAMLDTFAAEVVAERDAEIMRWLGKKAREYRATGRKADRERADLITVLTSKISRGAVRPNNTRLPAGITPTFFEPGRTYTSGTMKFRCEAISASPGTGERRALGWKYAQVYAVHHWYATALDPDDWEYGGWTEDTEPGQAPGPQPRRLDDDGRCRHCRRTPEQCDATGCGGRHDPYSAPWSNPQPETEPTVIEEFEAQHPDAMKTARQSVHAPTRPRARRKNADTPGAES